MNWNKKHESWFANLPGTDNKALVSTGANDKWYFSFNIGEQVWSSDPINHPFENEDIAKREAERVYAHAKIYAK